RRRCRGAGLIRHDLSAAKRSFRRKRSTHRRPQKLPVRAGIAGRRELLSREPRKSLVRQLGLLFLNWSMLANWVAEVRKQTQKRHSARSANDSQSHPTSAR